MGKLFVCLCDQQGACQCCVRCHPVQVVKRHLLPGQRACDVAAAKMLERDLVNEVEGAGGPCLVPTATALPQHDMDSLSLLPLLL